MREDFFMGVAVILLASTFVGVMICALLLQTL